MKTRLTMAENRAQAEAFRRMKGNVLELIALYAADFRQIITDYETANNRVPSADDLIWIESEHQHRDITRSWDYSEYSPDPSNRKCAGNSSR